MTQYILVAVWSYLLGSIPFGVWIGRKIKKVDIRDFGSGGTGATNAFRELGKLWGFVVLLLDAMKGALPVFLSLYLFQFNQVTALAFGLCAGLGHMFSVCLILIDSVERSPKKRPKGGKLVATALGALLAAVPLLAAAVVGVWIVTLFFSRMIGAASVLAAIFGIIITWSSGYPIGTSAIVSLMAAFIIYKHRPNIIRIFNGTEPKLGIFKKGE